MRRLIATGLVALNLLALSVGTAAASSAGSIPYDQWDHHIPFGVYFKEAVKVKVGYGYEVHYHTCYYQKVFDSRGYAFVKKVCG
jgi:hypothetical protein